MKARVLVGRNIRRLRVVRALSQEALGVAAEIEPSYVGRIERGRENVSVDLLEKLADALEVEIGALFTQPGGDLLPGLRPGRKPTTRKAVTIEPAVISTSEAAASSMSTGLTTSDQGIEDG